MYIEQIYTGCLAQGAYYIHHNGEAAIIDPLREVQPYIDRLEKDKVKLKFIFETHFHADFVSGHVTLSEKTGAPIIYGPNANPSFEAIIAEDDQVFELGGLKIRVLHTPGHTMESTTYLLLDTEGKEHCIFTGDTLFLGDVGRPDLAQKGADITQEDLAGILFDSLRNKIMPLPDDVTVYPAHGAGSACGKNMMKETVDTLGNQKQMNYALRADMTKEEFIKEVTDGLEAPPAYFPLNVKLNKFGYDSIDEVLDRGLQALSADAFETAAEQTEAIMLDVRTPGQFAEAHVPNSIFIGLKGGFAPWVGALIADIEQKILLIANPGEEEEAVTRLARVGFDHSIGFLKGGVEGWIAAGKSTETVNRISAEAFENDWTEGKVNWVADIRKLSEYEGGHVDEAENLPLSQINDHLSTFKNEGFHLHCAGGYRSMIAASILKLRGIHNFIEIEGGFSVIKKMNIPLTDKIKTN